MSKSNRKPRRKFSDEFKAEAVQAVRDAGGNVARTARELNLTESGLRKWVAIAESETDGAPTTVERAEIRELKKELERVKRERDILGKATAYFSARDPRNG